MKRVFITFILVLIVIGVVGGSYAHYQQLKVEEALEAADSKQLSTILNRPFIQMENSWMDTAVNQYDVTSALILFEHDIPISDEQWMYLADLMTFKEFEQMVVAGAPLEIATSSQTLVEGLYSLNDEPEKWRFAHEAINPSFFNEHPTILFRAVYDGNTEAFLDVLERMDYHAVPYDALVPLIQESGQNEMLEAITNKMNV